MVKRKRHKMKCSNPAEDIQLSRPRENKLLLELRKQKLSGMLCDVIFVYENFKLYSHACVLAAFSPYMMKLLLPDCDGVFPHHDNWCYKMPLKINLTDILHQSNHVCWKCFINIIDFMYTSKIYMYNCHLTHVEYAATVLQIKELLTVCTKFKESEYKKTRFNTIENTTCSITKNRMYYELKSYLSKLKQSEIVDPENDSNSELYRNSINKYLETSGPIADTECQNTKISKTTFGSVENSNKCKAESKQIKRQHVNISDSVFQIKVPKNSTMLSCVITKEKVEEPQWMNPVSPHGSDKINLNADMSTEQSSLEMYSNNIKNTLTKQTFSNSKTFTENENSQTQILNYTVNTTNSPQVWNENRDNKITTEKNKYISIYFTSTIENQSKIDETVESRQPEDNNTSKTSDEALLNIPFKINKEIQPLREEELYNTCDNAIEKCSTVNKCTLNVENINSSQVISEQLTAPIKSRNEKNELTNEQMAGNTKDAFTIDAIESSEISIHQIIGSMSRNHHNEIAESQVTSKKDNHESGLNVFESKKENKISMQVEQSAAKTKEKTKFSCQICQYKTLRLSKMVEHLEISHHNQTSCSICLYTFNDNIEFNQHLKLHKENFPFQCLTCNKRFKSIYYFKNHLHSHSSKKMFICSICNASFKHSYNLSRHTVNEHSETSDEKYICEHCGFITSAKYKLILHLQDHGFTVPVFTCSVNNCKFQTKLEDSLIYHEKMHFKTEPFVCEKCGSKFLHVKNLKRHIRQKHTPGLLMLQCSKCDYTTNRKDCLKSHMNCHSRTKVRHKTERKNGCTSNKPINRERKLYKCEICDEQFINRGNVQRHKISVHNLDVIKIKCNACSYRTTREDLYRKHISKHSLSQTDNHPRKYRKLACKTNDYAVCLIKTINNESVSCQYIENCTEIPKYCVGGSVISDNKSLQNKKENNSEVKNNCLVNPQINSFEDTALHPDKALSITDNYNTVYVCEICGYTVDNEDSFQMHILEHGVQQATGNQAVRENSCIQSKNTPEKKNVDRNNHTTNYINVLIPVNENNVTNLTNNVNLENKNCALLPHYKSDKQNVSIIDHQRNDNLADMNVSLSLSDSVEIANEHIGQFCAHEDCTNKEQFNSTNKEATYCNVELPGKQNENSPLCNIRPLLLNEDTGKLNVTEKSETKRIKQNYSDKTNKHLNVLSSCNTTQPSVRNFCNTLNSENCKVTRTCPDNIECVNIENIKPPTETTSTNVFTLHNVAELNRTIILNETTGEISFIINNKSNVTNDSENDNIWQNASSGTWILDESTGTLTKVKICNKQIDESVALSDQRKLISFPNQNTIEILNEGTGELTFINLNSDSLEKNENSDMIGSGHYFDDDTQSNFSVDSQEDFAFDNISLASPSNETNSVTEFLNELTGEINFCNFSGESNPNIVNNTNYINSNFKEKNNDKMTWNSSNDENEDLTFLNELTGEILRSTSKINSSNITSESVRIENNSLPIFEARSNTNVGNEILNETTGELSVHLDDELTKESSDSMYLNEETGIISWNTLNQATTESNILDKNADWFFENLQNDSLDSFTADDDNFSKQFQYNLFLNSPCEDLTLNVETNDTLLNESTGELISKINTEPRQ